MDTAPNPGERRRRRSQDEVKQRIEDAARALFAERGYADTTTRDIAQQADVSETLLFRHYGSKAALFDHVVFDPFETLATRLLGERPGSEPALPTQVIARFMEFLDHNRKLLTTLAVKGLEDTQDERAAGRLAAMARHYAEAAAWVRRQHETAGMAPAIDPDIAVRLGFGMVLASSLFDDWLFADGSPPRPVLVDALERLLVAALLPEARSG